MKNTAYKAFLWYYRYFKTDYGLTDEIRKKYAASYANMFKKYMKNLRIRKRFKMKSK